MGMLFNVLLWLRQCQDQENLKLREWFALVTRKEGSCVRCVKLYASKAFTSKCGKAIPRFHMSGIHHISWSISWPMKCIFHYLLFVGENRIKKNKNKKNIWNNPPPPPPPTINSSNINNVLQNGVLLAVYLVICTIYTWMQSYFLSLRTWQNTTQV